MKKTSRFIALVPFACVWNLLSLSFVAGQSAQALTGHSFVYTLKRQEFFGQGFTADDPVSLSPSIAGLPDLPEWMKFTQVDASQDGYLYGTPVLPSSENLQVVALNKKSYQTTINNLTISVQQSTVSSKYRVQIHIKNFNIEDMFTNNRLKQIRDAIHTQWLDGGDIFVTRVATFQDVGRRVPIPSYIGEIVKNGVLVEVGGTKDFSLALKSVPIEINIPSCREGGDGNPPVTMDTLFSPTFKVDWCSFKLVTVKDDGQQATTNGQESSSAINLGDGVFKPMDELPPRLNLFTDFIIIIVVPAAILVAMVIVLSCLFFGFRAKRGARQRQTPDLQLQQYASVRYATDRLRSMSQRREQAPSTVFSPPRPTASNFEPSEVSTPASDLDHPRTRDSFPPPPYRLPPSYPMDASYRSDDGFPDQHSNDDQYLVPERTSTKKY